MKLSPRYKFRNRTILDWLEVTPEEERHLKTIISDEERRRRDRKRKRKERRESGEVQMSRAEYEGRARDRRQEAPRLRSEGLSVRQIAAELGIGERRVKQLLKEHRESGVQSMSS